MIFSEGLFYNHHLSDGKNTCIEKAIEIIPMEKMVTVFTADTMGLTKLLPDYVEETTFKKIDDHTIEAEISHFYSSSTQTQFLLNSRRRSFWCFSYHHFKIADTIFHACPNIFGRFVTISRVFAWFYFSFYIHQDEIVTCVPSYANEKELTIGNLLKIPFTKIREWKSSERISKEKVDQLKE